MEPSVRRARAARLAFAFVLAGALASACGGVTEEYGSGRFVVQSDKVRLDQNSPRVKKADRDITRLVGHPVEFYFDSALVSTWEAMFEAQSIASIEVAADALSNVHDRSADIFAWAAPLLKRIEWDYSATNPYTHWEFDPKTGILRIVLTPRNENQSSEEAIRFALGAAYAKRADAQYAATDPQSVAPGDRAKYVDYIVELAYGREQQRNPPRKEEEGLDPVAARVTIMAVNAYATYRADPALEAKLRHYLLGQANHFAYVRRSHAEALDKLPPEADARRGETAFVGWLNATFETLTEHERAAFLEESAYVDRDEKELPFPGFDWVALYLRLLPNWIAAGHPAESTDATRDRDEMFGIVLGVGASREDRGGGCSDQRRRVYVRATTDSPTRDKLFGAAFATHDPAVVRLVMANLFALPKPDVAIAFWRASMESDGSFRAASRAVAPDVNRCASADTMFDALARIWKDNPAPQRRGVLLYVARHYGSNRYDLAHTLGPIAEKEWSAYLDEEIDPLREMHFVWPLLAKGYSHGAPVVTRLDRWLTDDYTKRESWWPETMDTLARDLCGDGEKDSLAQLHSFLEKRAALHPSEQRTLEPALGHTKPGGCPKSTKTLD